MVLVRWPLAIASLIPRICSCHLPRAILVPYLIRTQIIFTRSVSGACCLTFPRLCQRRTQSQSAIVRPDPSSCVFCASHMQKCGEILAKILLQGCSCVARRSSMALTRCQLSLILVGMPAADQHERRRKGRIVLTVQCSPFRILCKYCA